MSQQNEGSVIGLPERSPSFDELQSLLNSSTVPFELRNNPDSTEPEHIVLIPSETFMDVNIPITSEQLAIHFRFGVYFLFLRNPNCKIVFVTVKPFAEELIDYYLDLLQRIYGTHKSEARSRLLMISLDDPSLQNFAVKVGKRPDVKQQILDFVDKDKAYIEFLKTEHEERKLALDLGLPFLGPHEHFQLLELKSTCKYFFEEIGINTVRWIPVLCRNLDQLVDVIQQFHLENPDITKFLLKIDDEARGMGHSVIQVADFQHDNLRESILYTLQHKIWHANPEMTWELYQQKLNQVGVIVEELLPDYISCGLSLFIPSSTGKILIQDTDISHTTDKFAFVAAESPLYQPYLDVILSAAEIIGGRLQSLGYIGAVCASCLIDKRDTEPKIYFCELNLRENGGTHAQLTLAWATGGRRDDQGIVIGRDGNQKFMFYKNRIDLDGLPLDNTELIVARAREHPGLQYDAVRLTGVILHYIFGDTMKQFFVQSIGNSREEAVDMMNGAVEALKEVVKGVSGN